MLLCQQVVHVHVILESDNKMDDVCTAVRFAMDQLGVSTLKDKQKEAIHNFVRGHEGDFANGVLVLCLAAFRVQKRTPRSLFLCHVTAP